MPGTVGIVTWHIAGDVGGSGICRFHVKHQVDTGWTPTDAEAAATATRQVPFSCITTIPQAVTWTCDPILQAIDEITGTVAFEVTIPSVPPVVQGTGTGTYGAGIGARLNWHTQTVRNRRFMRGATFMVPLDSFAFNTTGSVTPAQAASLFTGGGACLTDLHAAALDLVVYHRPAKGATSGGVSGVIVGQSVPTTPAGLRSRRS